MSATEWRGHLLSSSMPVGRVSTDKSGSFQNSTARTSPAKCQGGDGTNAAAPSGDRGAMIPLSIVLSHQQRRISPHRFSMKCLALVRFPTLGQTSDDLVACVPPTLNSTRPGGLVFYSTRHTPLSGIGRTAAGSKATKADVSLQARTPARAYSFQSD